MAFILEMAAAGVNDAPLLEYEERQLISPTSSDLTIVAYNIERGLHLDHILDLWKHHEIRHADVVLLTECDRGMARTQNRHVTRDFADALGYSYAFAVEFNELSKGKGFELKVPGENTSAEHGNAILSRYPLQNVEAIRLPAFRSYQRKVEPRTGSRNAILADIDVNGKAFTVVSTHLESHSAPEERKIQTQAIIDAASRRDKGQPIVIGGDMNTSTLNVRQFYWSLLKGIARVYNPSMEDVVAHEPLFDLLEQAGYDYHHCNQPGYTLNVGIYKGNLDWFFIKNLQPGEYKNPLIHREFENHRRYSDHIPISIELLLS